MDATELLTDLLNQMSSDPDNFTVRKHHLKKALDNAKARAAVPAPAVPPAPAPELASEPKPAE